MIEFQDVHQGFHGRPVLKGLSFRVRQGETFVLMGPSGSGKSTTLLHIVGVHRARSGKVLVQGIDVGEASPEEMSLLRRRIGMVFQSAALLNWLDVFDNVALPLRETTETPEAQVKARVQEALAMVKLEEDGDKFPHELSGGMRKRVGLARAIVTNAPLILYDEPTAGLDPAMSSQIDHLIRNLQKTLGVTSVVVTHDVRTAERVADRMAILSGGRVRAEGGRDLLGSDDPVVREFLGKAVPAGETA